MKGLILLAVLAAVPAQCVPIIVGNITYNLLPGHDDSIGIFVTGGLARDFIDVPIELIQFQVNGFINYGDVGQETIGASVGYVGLPPVLTGGSILETTIIGSEYPALIGHRLMAEAQPIVLQNPTFGLGETGYLTVEAFSLIVPEPGTFLLMGAALCLIGARRLYWVRTFRSTVPPEILVPPIATGPA